MESRLQNPEFMNSSAKCHPFFPANKIQNKILLSNIPIVVPNKSDSDVVFCLQLLSKTLTCKLHLSLRESIYHLCINPPNIQEIYRFYVSGNFVNKT